jgi:hypothetical protein
MPYQIGVPDMSRIIVSMMLIFSGAAAAATSPAPPGRGGGPPAGEFGASNPPNGSYATPVGAGSVKDSAKLPDFSGVWMRAEGLIHPDQSKILPFMTPAAAAEWRKKIAARDFYVPWSNCEPPAFPALLTEFGLPIEFLMTPGRVTLLTPDGQTHSIYTDGSRHPAAPSAGTYFGHAIGHWENGTLVAVTRNLRADNQLVMGLPAGTDNMVVTERLTLESANRLRNDITVTGPDFLAKPYQYTQYFRRLEGVRLGEFVCLASRNRNTGNSVDLTPPSFDP